MKKILSILLASLMLFGGSFTAYAQEEPQANTSEILVMLGANDVSDVYSTRGDGLVNDSAKRIDFNGTSYALLDESNSIVRINRLDEIDKLYLEDVSKQDNHSRFENTDALIGYIENAIIGASYKCTAKSYFDETTISLRYEKKLDNGGFDNFDSYSIYIDEKYNEIVSLYKRHSSYIEQRSGTLISESDAIRIATKCLGMESTAELFDIELATVKTNDTFNKQVSPGEIKLAYIIKSSFAMVYVDAYTGEVIGGDYFKAILGGAIGATDVSTASDSVALAKKTLEAMGYKSTSTSVTTQFKTEVPKLLKSAFYSCSHGNSSVISSKKNMDDENRLFYASSVPSGTYKFVFLDACNTASKTWKDAFGISSSSSNKAFLGWSDTVGTNASYEFCKYFWANISSSTSVRQAAINAASSQGDDLPISFTGDRNYNGYY